MALSFNTLQDSIREREFGLSSLMPDIGDYNFSSADSSLSYFQNLMRQTSQADLGRRETGSLYDAIGGAAWGFTDMATAHLLRGSWAFDTGGKSLAEEVGGVDMATKAGQYAEQAGEALGFLVPMGKVAKGIRWGVQGTKVGARTISKALAKETGDRLAAKGAVEFTSKAAALKAGGKSANKHFYEAVDDAFIKRWYDKTGPAKVDGFGSAFQKVADKNKFINSVRDNMGTSLTKMAQTRGVKLGKGTADDITEIFSTYFTDPKKFPVSSIGEMVARKFGIESKLATAYTHMFEEAVTFATFEGLLEAVDSVQQEREYDFGVIPHAAAMGHILGAIRFIPGGKKFGGTIFGQGGGVSQFRMLMRNLKPYKNRIDSSNEAHRKGAFKLWSYLKDGSPLRNNNKTGDILRDFTEKHPIWKAGTFEGIKKTSINTANSTNISTILREGSESQKRAMGDVMRDGLDKIRVDFKRDWFPQFMKEYKKDVVGSLPRMFLGGVAMSGGPSIFFDDSIALEDKMFSIMLGGFMMRRGHELSTRRVTQNKKGDNVISFVEPRGFFGGKKPTSYGEHFERLTADIKMLGGNPWSWGGYRDLMNGRGSSVMDLQDKLPVGDTEFGKKIKGVLEDTVSKAGNSIITTEKELKVFDPKKSDPPSSVEAAYEMYIQAARNLVPVETKIKGWNNLSSAGKRAVEKQLKDKGFSTPEDILEARTADNVDIFSTADAVGIVGAVESLKEVGIIREPDSNGIYRLPKLEAQGEHSPETLEAINHYNDYLNIFEISGKIKIDVTEEMGSPRNIITPEQPGLDRFVNSMENVHEKYSNLFGYGKETGYEIFPDDRTFLDLIRIKTFFENKQNVKGLMDNIASGQDFKSGDIIKDQRIERARTLFTQIFQDEGMWRGYIQLKKGGDWRNQNFVDNLGKIARTEMGVRSRMFADKKVKDYSVKEDAVNQLREIFRAEGVNLFEKKGRETQIFLEQYKLEHKKKSIVKGGMVGKNGKRVDVTPEAMATTLALTETGFLNSDLTMARWGTFEDSFIGLASKANKSWYGMFVGGKAEDISSLVLEMKAVGNKKGIDTSNITEKNMKTISKAFKEYVSQIVDSPAFPEIKTEADGISHLKGDISYIYKTLENRVRPLIQTVKNGERIGFIKLNTKDTVHLTPEGVLNLKNHMLAIDKLRESTDMDSFITELSEATIDPAKRMKSFSKYMLSQISRQSWKNTDSIKVMELASAHRIWNPIERKFDTQDMSEATLNTAIEKVLRGFTRGQVNSNSVVESIMRRLERDSMEDGQGENSYSSMTFAELTKKYDFSEYEFAIGNTDGVLDRQIQPKGGIETAEQQLQNIYNKYYGSDNRVAFAEALIDAARHPKEEKGGKQYQDNPDQLYQDIGKAILDQSNTFTVPILNYNQSRTTPGMTMVANNVMKISDTYRGIERAMGGTPLLTNHVQIIPEKFLGTTNRNVIDKDTGDYHSELRPVWKSLTHSEVKNNQKFYPNEELVNQQLFQDDKLTFDASFRRAADGEPDNYKIPKGVLYMPYAQKWGYNIPFTPEMVNVQANRFIDLLREMRVPKDLRTEWLDDLSISIKDGEAIVDISKVGDAKSAMSWVKRLLDTSLGLDMFGDNYINNKLYEMDSHELGNLLRRGTLFSSGNSNELRSDVLGDIATIYERPDASTTLQAHAREYRDLIAGRKKRVTIQDEMQQDMFDILNEHRREIQEAWSEEDVAEMEAMPGGKGKVAAIRKYVEMLSTEVSRFSEDAPSSQEAGTIVEPGHFDALASLYSGTREMHIGGLKAIMLRAGNDFYVNKTALTKNMAYREFFDNNPDVAQLSFTSGHKKFNKQYYGELADNINDAIPGWETSSELNKMTLRPEDYKISFVKGNKDKATIAPNTFTFAHGVEKEVYNYYFKQNVKDKIKDMSTLHSIDQYEEAIAQNKFWTDKSMRSASEDWAMDSPLALEHEMANANIIPYLTQHSKSWERNIKTNIIDPLIKPKIDGGQFVHQGIHPSENVRNSIHYWDDSVSRFKIHRFGEFNAPATLKNVPYDHRNTFFVKVKDIKDPTSDTGKDLISFDELKATEGLQTYEMSTIQTENGIFKVHSRHKTGDMTRYGKVRSIQSVEKKTGGEWWESKDIGELNDRIPEGYQIFTYVMRHPFVGADSVIPVLMKREFKALEDGNSGSLNKMDGQISAELDNDIDIVNVWWNGPKEFASHIVDRKGEVPWGDKPTNNSKTSMDGLKPFDVDSHSNYRGILSEADALKGRLMNFQSIIDWLWKHNSGQMVDNQKGQGSSQTFHVGKNLFAGIQFDPVQRQKIKQRLRNDIQGIVDGPGGYDVNYYSKWERDFLFEGDNPVFMAKRMHQTGKYETLDVKLEDRFAQDLIIDNLISPYRRLKSLTNSQWEGTRAKKHNYDDFIHGIRKYDSELLYANKRAKKQARGRDEFDIDDIFQGWNYQARLFGKRNEGDYEGMLPFDRLLAATTSMDYRNMIDTPPSGTRNPYEYADILESLIHAESPSDFAKLWGNEFRNFSDSQFFVKNLQKQRDSYNKLAGKVYADNPKMSRDLKKKANAVQGIINKKYHSQTFKYEINKKGVPIEQHFDRKNRKWVDAKKPNKAFKEIYKAVADNWRERLLKEALKGKTGEKRVEASYKFHKDNNTNGDGKRPIDILVRKKINDKGLVVEAHPDHDMISAMAAYDSFGLLAHNKPYEYTTNTAHVEAIHQQLLRDADRLGMEWNRTWASFNNGTNPSFSERQIEQNFMDKIGEKYKEFYDIGGNELANQFMWQLMTPKFDLSKLVMTGNKTYFAPKDGNWANRTMLGLRFINKTDLISTDAKRIIYQDYVANLNRSFLAFHHHRGQNDLFMSNSDMMVINDRTGALERRTSDGLLDIRNQYKTNPLDYSKSGTMEEVLSEVHPGFEGMSATMSYKQMLEMFGSGGIPEILSVHRAYYMPAGAITDVSRFGPHMSISGYPSFLKAQKMGINAYIKNEKSRSTLDPEGTFENMNPLSEHGRKKSLEEEVYETYTDILCNQGNGSL